MIILNKALEYLIYLIPILLLTGPALPDIALSLSCVLFIILSIMNREWIYYKNKFIIFFLIWCLYLVFSSTLSNHILHSYESSLFHFRFILFSLAIWYLFEHIPNLIKNLFYIFTLIYLFLIIDSIFQFYYGYDLFLIEKRGESRISSVFGDESILGSYLVRFLPFYLCLFFYLKEIRNRFLFYFLIIFIYLIIFFSGERTSIAMLLILNFMLIIFIENYKIHRLFLLIIPFLLIIILFLFSNNHYKRILNYSHLEISSFINNTFEQDNQSESLSNLPSIRLGLYKSAYNIFQENILIGSGPKNFRIECKKFQKQYFDIIVAGKKEDPIIGCSTHPHNNFIQLLSETGILGTIPVLFIYLFIVYKILLFPIFYKRDQYNYNNINQLLLFSFFINFFPLLPSGSFFNNWLNIIYFFPLGFYLFLINKKNN